MADVTPASDYSYRGWLLFNGLFEARRQVNKTPAELISELPQHSNPTPGENMKGYRQTDFDQILARTDDVTTNLHRLAEQLFPFEYRQTKWASRTGLKNGQEVTIDERDDKVSQIFWNTDSDLMVFKGQKRWMSRNRKKIRENLIDKLRLNEIEFDRDFFVWVLNQKFIGQGLSSDLSIREINDIDTVGEDDRKTNVGNNLHVGESKNVLRSVPFLASFFQGNKPDMIEARFVLDNNQVRARVEHGGKVHVKVTDSELSEMEDLKRMGIALRFVFALLRQYQMWESLPATEKYPERSFFTGLAENMETEDHKFTGTFENVLKYYEMKRQGFMVDDGIPRSSRQDSS